MREQLHCAEIAPVGSCAQIHYYMPLATWTKIPSHIFLRERERKKKKQSTNQMSSKKLFWCRNKVMKRDKMTHFKEILVTICLLLVFVCSQSVWMCFLEPPSFSSHSPETRRSDERNSKMPVGVNRSVNLSPFASTNWLVTDSRSVRHCFLSCVWLNTVHAGGALTLHSSAGRRLWIC